MGGKRGKSDNETETETIDITTESVTDEVTANGTEAVTLDPSQTTEPVNNFENLTTELPPVTTLPPNELTTEPVTEEEPGLSLLLLILVPTGGVLLLCIPFCIALRSKACLCRQCC